MSIMKIPGRQNDNVECLWDFKVVRNILPFYLSPFVRSGVVNNTLILSLSHWWERTGSPLNDN